MQKTLILFLHFILVTEAGISKESCPNFILCQTSEHGDTCPEGKFYRENIQVHGCCPGCKDLKGENVTCEIPAECQPGLTCKSSKKCERDPSQACEFYKRYDPIFNKTKYWNPVCLPDGSYAPKQCKGEKMAGKCFCVNKMGERIFGEEDWSKAENMTCACSVQVERARKTGTKVDFHCDHLGNFEPLQCDQEVCWCANPTTGIPYTPAVPLETIISLPCYNRNAVGAQYYRQCDSAKHVQEVAESLLWNHGTTEITLTSQNCNFDGSYHRVSRGKKRCVFLDNSPLVEAIELKNATCNCVYDKHVAQLKQTEFSADCLPNGNYNNMQVWNEKVYCVDEDGFHYSNDPADCSLRPVTALRAKSSRFRKNLNEAFGKAGEPLRL